MNKHNFFTVPKDPAKLEQWKKAIRRKNFVIKPRQVVCTKYCLMADVFELKFTELLENNVLCFPCFQHSEEIITFAIMYYINMRITTTT